MPDALAPMFSLATCTTALLLVVTEKNPSLGQATSKWIAQSLCAAAQDTETDPRLLAAYMLNENSTIDLYAVRPGARGLDRGLFLFNTYHQAGRTGLDRVHHPYHGAHIAAEVIRDNIRTFGWTWQAYAAYWSHTEASAGTPAARQYYARLTRNFRFVDERFHAAIAQIERDARR